MAERTAAVRLTLRNDGFVAGLRQASSQAKGFADDLQSGVKRNKGSLDTLGNSFGVVGLAAAGVATVAVKSFADFDAAMSNVQAATHETAGNMAALRDAAVQAGKDTAFSATEAAGAIENLAKAGVSTKDILGGGLRGALDLAAAGQLDVGAAAEIAATAMTQFKLSGKDIPHIADLLAAGAGKAQGEVTDMAQALKQSGLVASQFGLSVDETVGTLSAFASAGLIGSDAGTSFKTMLLALANPSVKAASTLQDLGIAAYDAQGNFVGIAPLAEQLKSKLSALAPAQRDSALATIFGSDAIRAANVLYQNGAAGIADWTTKVNDQGYAAETAAAKTDNLKGDLERLGGAIDTALIQSGEGANDVLRSLVQGADDAVSAFSDLPGWVQKGAFALTGLVGAGGLGAAGLTKGVQAAASLREALQTLGKVSLGLKISLGGIGLALAAAGAVYAIFAKRNAEAKQRADELRDTLDQQTGAITGNTRAYVANQLAQSGLAQAAKDFGLNLSQVTDAALGNRQAMDSVVATLDTIIERNDALASGLPEGSNKSLRDQADAARALKAELTGQNQALTEAQQKQKLAAEGAKENKSAQELQAEAVKAANEAFQKQTEDLQTVIDKLHAASGAALDLSGAQIGLQAAIDKAAESAKENGKTLDINTEKGRANRSALNDIAQAANDQTDAMLKAGKSNVTVAKTAEQSQAQFVQQAIKMGLSKKEAEKLAQSLIDIPNVTREARLQANITDLESKLATAKTKLSDKKLTATQRANIEARIAQLEAAIRKAKEQLNSVPKSKTVTITTRLVTVRKSVTSGSGVGGGHEVSGPGSAGGGLIPGPPSAVDNHLRPMATGEYVVQASKVPGNLALLDAINSGRYRQTNFTPFSGSTARAPEMPPVYVDNHIEVGGEVVRVVRTEIKASDRDLKRKVTAGRRF